MKNKKAKKVEKRKIKGKGVIKRNNKHITFIIGTIIITLVVIAVITVSFQLRDCKCDCSSGSSGAMDKRLLPPAKTSAFGILLLISIVLVVLGVIYYMEKKEQWLK